MQRYDLAIASDHAGFKLKSVIIDKLSSTPYGLKIKNYGTDTDQSVDYPDFVYPITQAIIDEIVPRAILICGSGIGMSIAANRNTDIRAALCVNEQMAQKARQNNDANILILGAHVTDQRTAMKMVDLFISTEFEGGRHAKRLNKIR